MTPRMLMIFVTVALALAQPGGDPTLKKDMDAMQGVWRVAEITEKGEKLPEKDLVAVTVVIQGDRMVLADDGKPREEILVRLVAGQKTKAVDFFYAKGPNTGKLERGIYAIEGDTIKFCMNELKDGVRPADFVSTKTNGCSVAVLKRVKK